VKSASAELKAHLAGEVSTLAICWKVTLTDATVIAFTDHVEAILFDAVTYAAAGGGDPSNVSTQSGLNVDELEIEALFDAAGITEADIVAGRLDHAEVRVFMVNYADLTQGSLKLRRGWLGELSTGRGAFTAEVRGLAQRLQQRVGEFYSALCRAELGDARCKVTLGSYTVTGTITGITDTRVFADSSRSEADNWFRYGVLTWTSGNNDGRSEDVKAFTQSTGEFELVRAMPEAVQVGDGYSVYAGCDKRHATCKSKFDNIINRRAEDFVPSREKAFGYGTGG
jgi:uncharacterized phage protein (TIGR02218 family)